MKWLAILAMAILTGCGERDVVGGWDQGEEWDQWARGVEARYPVSDADGHGPDIGSEEWARALQQKLGIEDDQGHGPDLGSAEWRAAVQTKISQ
jgi:hypothetical protein